MNRKNLVLTTLALLSLVFVTSALLPALAQADENYLSVTLINRTNEVVNFEAEWSNQAGTYHSGFKSLSIPPGYKKTFESRRAGARFRVNLNGQTYKLEGTSSVDAVNCIFKYDQDNVVLIRGQ